MSDDMERLGRLAANGVADHRFRLEEVLREIENHLRNGHRPTAEQIDDLRRALNFCLQVTENDLAAVVDGVEPWERPPDVPYPSHQKRTQCSRYEP